MSFLKLPNRTTLVAKRSAKEGAFGTEYADFMDELDKAATTRHFCESSFMDQLRQAACLEDKLTNGSLQFRTLWHQNAQENGISRLLGQRG